MAKSSSSIFSQLFSSSSKTAKKIGGIVFPTFLKRAAGAATITDPTQNRTNLDLTTLRNSSSQKEVIRQFIDNSPDLSMAAATMARFAITDSYTVVAYSVDGKIDPVATETANALANRLDRLAPTYDGYNLPNDFRSLSERAIKCLLISGSMGSEMVLGKGAVPERLSIFSTRLLKFEERNGKIVPYLVLNGENIYIDSPLALISDLDQDVETAYSTSPYNAATQPVIADQELANMLRRAFGKANLPRLSASIDHEAWIKTLTPDTQYDPEKLGAAMTDTIEAIRNELNGLQPEDAVVTFNTVELDHLSAGNTTSHESAKEQREMINGRISAGTRTLPSILGRGVSSGTASVEAMMYLRSVEGIQEKLNYMYSTHLTVGTRLLGHDVFVKFEYCSPELRPKSELITFVATKQSVILEQLSLGLISDEEASIALTGNLPSGNYTPLSGTGFRDGTSVDAAENPYSNTSVDGGISDTQGGKEMKPGGQKSKTNKTTG